jgi:hypothetical protein
MPEYGNPDWADDSKCLVCKSDMGKSVEIICSATCHDISSIFMDMEDACYD